MNHTDFARELLYDIEFAVSAKSLKQLFREKIEKEKQDWAELKQSHVDCMEFLHAEYGRCPESKLFTMAKNTAIALFAKQTPEKFKKYLGLFKSTLAGSIFVALDRMVDGPGIRQRKALRQTPISQRGIAI